MVKVIDQRPTRVDSLRKLITQVKTPASVPHGVKVARPGEGVRFFDSEGAGHLWDGDAIAAYDARMSEAETKLAEAETALEQASAELEDAKGRIDAAGGDLSAYIEKVDAAQAAATKAANDLKALDTRLASADSSLKALTSRVGTTETKAGELSTAVENALTQSSSAGSLASEAMGKAEDAAAEAARVSADAANAVSAAEEAERKALEAAGIAGGKGKVIYSSSAPTGADQNASNLWIRSSDNRPHRWSGSAWVAVTDKVATDAAASAAAANSLASQAKAAADKAQADATRASTQAQDAMRAANQAQDSANGKNTVSYTTGTPAGVGTRLGDTHYQVNAAGTVLRWWRWSGTAWVEQALDGQVISSLDAGKITAGTLDAARIKAGSITANKLTVGVGPNLFPPLSAEHLAGAVNPTQWRVDATGGLGGVSALVVLPGVAQPGTYPALAPNDRARVESPYFIPVQPGQKYRVSVWVKGTQASTGSQTAAIYGRFYGEAGGSSYVWATPSNFRAPITTGWTQMVGYFTIPEDTGSGVRPTRLVVGFYTSGTYPGDCWFSSPEVMAMTPGDLIVNGSITGQQINAQSVGAVVGEFVQVRAQNVEITGELVGRVVNAMTAQHKNLVVTESAVLQHATLLGTTVAEQLNVTKKLIARDAIVNGTLDVAQLNVTVGMAAAIVNAMDVNAKRLVVTEDAILQRATVIQGLVTPELIAQKISVQDLGAKLISTSALQTDTASNRGVKITSTGINAWDTTGRQTIRLDGTNNLITGQLATGDETVGRIKLFNATHPVNRRPAGFITIHDTGGTAGKQGVVEYNDQQLMLSIKDGFEGGYSQPFRKGLIVTPDGASLVGNLLLEGQFKKSPAFRAHSISLGHIPANHYKEFTQPFTPVNGQSPYSISQLASSNFANVSAVGWTDSKSVKIRVYNNSGFEATHVWCDLILLGLER